MATTAKLGCFLIDSASGRLLAMDARAAEEFSICPDATGSGAAVIGAAKIGAAGTGGAGTGDLQTNGPHLLCPDLTAAEWNSLTQQKDQQGWSLSTRVQRSDGSLQLATLSFLPLSAAEQDYLLLTIGAMTANPAAVVHRDALTGLPDRRELVRHHQRWLQTTANELPSLALLFMDLDHFKQINDQHGHAVGDQVLVTLANRWQGCVRGGDIVVRYGGDEFVVLLTGITQREDVQPVLARLTKAAADPILVGTEQLTIGVTIGLALCESKSTKLEQLIHTADLDMYASKRRK